MAVHLKAARVNAGFTQAEVVTELRGKGYKISKNTLVSYELYRTMPDIETAKALATLYGMTVDNIIFFKK